VIAVPDRMPSVDALAAQLVTLVENRLLDPLEILLESTSDLVPVRSRVARQADGWAEQLLSPDEALAQRAVIRLVVALFPGDGPFDPPPGWWRTPLGRVMAGRVGHPGAESVSYAVAGSMLGISRQGVHDLVTRGKLQRHEKGGVATSSVRERINRQARQRELIAGGPGPLSRWPQGGRRPQSK
jgi:hypothetical protein